MINIIHRVSKKGRNYAEVASITPLPKGMKDFVPEQVLPTIKYMIEDGADGVFELLPEWIQKGIMASEEWEQGDESTSDDDDVEEELESVNAELAAATN